MDSAIFRGDASGVDSLIALRILSLSTDRSDFSTGHPSLDNSSMRGAPNPSPLSRTLFRPMVRIYNHPPADSALRGRVLVMILRRKRLARFRNSFPTTPHAAVNSR